VKIALCQINTTIGDFEGNVSKVLQSLDRARMAGCGLAVFPELTLTGYPPRDLLERPAFLKAADRALRRVARSARGIAATVGTVLPNRGPGNPLFNAAVTVKDGRILHVARKVLLPNYDVFDEDRYFEPAPGPARPFSLGGLAIGVTVCEDIWNTHPVRRPLYDRDPVRELAKARPDVVVNLSASPFHRDKLAIRQGILASASRRLRCPVLYCNLVGGNDDLVFDGASMAVDAKGRLVSRAPDFEEDLLVFGTVLPRRDVRPVSADDAESQYRALVLGTRDYVRKCGFTRVLVGLSGGIDSALVACIAVEALGSENVLGVTMPSPYSSRGSVEDSRTLANALGIDFRVLPITGAFRASLKALAPAFRGARPGLAEENLQARLRGMFLMALSNKSGRLVLSTGNKSELAVGYCTLYGDMCGGLAVISDLPKHQVYRLARHANRHRRLIPEAVFRKAPSAELRPNQTDQDTLPPYDVLDAVLKHHVEDRWEPSRIVKAGYRRSTVAKVVRWVAGNEYKRRQMAPGLKVTTKAFGIGRRMPLAQRFTEE
jgi:NAD+ synthase/NAD+ synthase (glutamine-hydrolysing)